MTEAMAPPATTPTPVPVPAPTWPSLKPISPGSPIIETWGGYAAPCPDCGFMVKRKTVPEVAEALADRDTWHGLDACREAAARLTEAEKASLQQLYMGTPETVEEKPRKKKAPKGGA